jgi:hypothetical protein
MRVLRWFLIASTGFLLAGCAGYTLGPTNGDIAGDRTIQISPFGNNTMEPHLGDALTDALRQQLQHDGTFRLATSDPGDILVTGYVTSYIRREQDFSQADADVALDYRISLTAQITARERSTGKILLNQPVNGYTLIRVGPDLTSSERQALPLLAEDLAKNITSLLVDGKW